MVFIEASEAFSLPQIPDPLVLILGLIGISSISFLGAIYVKNRQPNNIHLFSDPKYERLRERVNRNRIERRNRMSL